MKDKLLFTDEQIPLAKEITEEILDMLTDNGDTLIVSIGGLSGTGKTEVSFRVEENLLEFGKYAYILSLDGFYYPKHESTRKACNNETVGIGEIDWSRVNNSVKNLYHVQAYHVIILEGVYACHYEADFRIYIDQSYNDSYEFRLARGKEKPDCETRKDVLRREAIDVKSTKRSADMVVKYDNH